ncbi:hypothetical protein Tco_1517155 [Tanacetum coccineum]|uniref:Uncharacterized protein n=1 Tax=Tanacetum coccineum TaxID=301880 RepID=A0ABQ5C776_9ASTR
MIFLPKILERHTCQILLEKYSVLLGFRESNLKKSKKLKRVAKEINTKKESKVNKSAYSISTHEKEQVMQTENPANYHQYTMHLWTALIADEDAMDKLDQTRSILKSEHSEQSSDDNLMQDEGHSLQIWRTPIMLNSQEWSTTYLVKQFQKAE